MIRFFLLFLLSFSIVEASPPKVLIVAAHSDDNTLFAATTYKITHELNGIVDLLVITNGEGGYKYSTLGESIYGLKLTDEAIGRRYLPRIRKMEAINAGKILGIRNYFFLGERDTKYTQDPLPVLQGEWNTQRIKQQIQKHLKKENYDYIFVMMPTKNTHGHHKAATILTLKAIKELEAEKPIILGSLTSEKEEQPLEYVALEDFPITEATIVPTVSIDRTKKFGYKDSLDYKMVVNWVIAEHKSQGTMQLYMNRGDKENFYFFNLNDPHGKKKIIELFEALNNKTP